MPKSFLQGMTNNVIFTFSVGDTTWAAYIEQKRIESVPLNKIMASASRFNHKALGFKCTHD